MRLGSRSVWRSRALLFALLGVLLLVNVAVLVSHSVFYEARLKSLQEERRTLEKRRDESRAAAQRVDESRRHLAEIKAQLDVWNKDQLGGRRERIAPLIEDIYAVTRKAGFAPSGFSFFEEEVPGARRLTMGFDVSGRYAEIKKLLAAFENNPEFLVLERVTVSIDESSPDALKVALTVAHYFRSEEDAASVAIRRRARESR